MKEIRDLVQYHELSLEWQHIAVENHGSVWQAEEETYIEPLEHQNPYEHILFDFSDCIPSEEYNYIIPISNTMAIGVNLVSDRQVELIYL